MTESTNFDDLVREVMGDADVRAAVSENSLRRKLGKSFESSRLLRNWSMRELAQRMGTSLSQVQRVLHRQQGGSLTLLTICRAADALGMHVDIHVRPRLVSPGQVVQFGHVAWERSAHPVRERATTQQRPPARALGREDDWRQVAEG